MWIREGLEKLEKKKQKKQDQEDEDDSKKSSVNLSASGSSSIAGYDHGKVDSPVGTPKSNYSDEVHVNLRLQLITLLQKNCLLAQRSEQSGFSIGFCTAVAVVL